jgi:SSS family solute:Na+ symporter
MNQSHPYSYIRALYNTLVCLGVAILAVFTAPWQAKTVSVLQNKQNGKTAMNVLTGFVIFLIILVTFNIASINFQILAALGIIILVPFVVTYFVQYDEEKNTKGLIAGSIGEARRHFKDGEPNDEEGEKVFVHWKQIEGDTAVVRFSTENMAKMKAQPGDLVYLSDKRKWLGGLKSIHSVFGEPHDEPGVVYVTDEQIDHGLFVPGRILEAEKEM